MQIKIPYKNKGIVLFIFLLGFLNAGCGKNADVSGTYKKVSGDYRYDTIIIQKSDNRQRQNEFWISTYQDGKIKFKTKSILEDKRLDLGFIAPMKFDDDYKNLLLELRQGSTFEKQINKTDKEN
jgi:hypothetical protein